MAEPNEITLWRAPASVLPRSHQELQNGFDARDYPDRGLFFTTQRQIAVAFEYNYQNGIQEFFMRREDFDRLVDLKMILPDELYPKGQSWIVAPQFILEFNAALKKGSPGTFHSE